jgi:L1 cell adhesion molecule like protein
MSKAPAIGIDLGTTYSSVGVCQNGIVDIIPNDMGERTTPSYVAFTDTERLVGDAAKNQITLNPTNTMFDSKRLIGRKYEEIEVQDDIKLWPFKVVKDPNQIDHEFKLLIESKKKNSLQKNIRNDLTEFKTNWS